MLDLGTDEFIDLDEIGRGGFGVVFTARQPAFDRVVAVKVLTLTDERTLRRFDRERQALGKVSNHPNIAPVFASGFTSDGQPYLAMELMKGGSLADRIASEGAMPWQEVLDLGVKLAGALETAHRAGILHRDLKPANILLSEYGEPRLADFGIASLDDGEQTKTGVITASVAYAAPEVLDGRRPGVQADIYGLAATLFTLVAGSAPFSTKDEESVLAMVLRIARDPVPDLRAQGVPDGFARVLETAMAKSSDDRYVTASAFGAALRDAQQQVGLPQTPMILPRSVGTTPTSLATTSFDLTSDPLAISGPLPSASPGSDAPPAPPGQAPPSGDPAHAPSAHGGVTPAHGGGAVGGAAEGGAVPAGGGWQAPPAGHAPQGAPGAPAGQAPATGQPSGVAGGPPPGSATPGAGGGGGRKLAFIGAGILAAGVVVVAGLQLLGGDDDTTTLAESAAADSAPADAGAAPADADTVPDDAVDAAPLAPPDAEGTAPTAASSEPGAGDVAATIDAGDYTPPTPIGGWVAARAVPVPRQQVPGVELRGRMWVTGGLDEEGVTATVQGYEIASNSWRAGPDLPLALHHHMTATFGSDLVVLGGWTPQGSLLSATVSDRVLALRGSAWVDLPPLLEPRVAGAAANVDGQIIVVGGQDVAGQLVTTTEIFDGQTWREGAPLPTPREHLAAATDGRYLYVVGGRVLSADANLPTVERYDPVADEWEQLPNMPTARGGLAAVVVDGRILVAIGGERALGVFDEVEAYDLQADTGEWTALPSLPTGRHGLAAAAVGSTVLTVGGALEPSHAAPTDTVEVIGIE